MLFINDRLLVTTTSQMMFRPICSTGFVHRLTTCRRSIILKQRYNEENRYGNSSQYSKQAGLLQQPSRSHKNICLWLRQLVLSCNL
jgi:hypothetical protein